jgi:hypothetical protein
MSEQNMDQADISAKVFREINDARLSPRPAWHFSLLSFALGGLSALMLLWTALNLSALRRAWRESDAEMIMHPRFEVGLAIFWPAFFLMLAALALFGSAYIYRRLGDHHRLPFVLAVLAGAGLVFPLTVILVEAGAGDMFEPAARHYTFVEPSFENERIERWMQPDQGFLSGRIMAVASGSLQIEDFGGSRWSVDVVRVQRGQDLRLAENEFLRLIGEMRADEHFVAEEIRPWSGVRGCLTDFIIDNFRRQPCAMHAN